MSVNYLIFFLKSLACLIGKLIVEKNKTGHSQGHLSVNPVPIVVNKPDFDN